nr:hypothetical protein [uncultured Campylobacter sp.]
MENLLLAQLREALPQGMRVPSLRRFMRGSRQTAFMTTRADADAAISTRKIGCSRAGATMSARAARTLSFSRMSRKIATRS